MSGSAKSKLDKQFDIDVTKKDRQIEALESQLEKERDQRKEDRFYFILFALILINVVSFAHIPTWTGPISILFIEVIVVLAMSKKLGMEDIEAVIDKLLSYIPQKEK